MSIVQFESFVRPGGKYRKEIVDLCNPKIKMYRRPPKEKSSRTDSLAHSPAAVRLRIPRYLQRASRRFLLLHERTDGGRKQRLEDKKHQSP